jgi:hypothetical protein
MARADWYAAMTFIHSVLYSQRIAEIKMGFRQVRILLNCLPKMERSLFPAAPVSWRATPRLW